MLILQRPQYLQRIWIHSVAEQESVFIRYVCNGEPTNRFIALVELTSETASGVIKAIDNALNIVGVGIDEQKNKLVNINLALVPI